MPRAAAPHSTASSCSTVGVLTRRKGEREALDRPMNRFRKPAQGGRGTCFTLPCPPPHFPLLYPEVLSSRWLTGRRFGSSRAPRGQEQAEGPLLRGDHRPPD